MGRGLPAAVQPGQAPLVDGHAGPGRTIGLWASGEYLLWWTKNGRIAPVVTAGGNGVLGSAGTRVLIGNLDFDNDVRQGARFALGYNFVKNPLVGIEAGSFLLAERQSEVSFSSGGRPVLAQPFTNAMLGKPDATLVAAPQAARGEVKIKFSKRQPVAANCGHGEKRVFISGRYSGHRCSPMEHR